MSQIIRQLQFKVQWHFLANFTLEVGPKRKRFSLLQAFGKKRLSKLAGSARSERSLWTASFKKGEPKYKTETGSFWNKKKKDWIKNEFCFFLGLSLFCEMASFEICSPFVWLSGTWSLQIAKIAQPVRWEHLIESLFVTLKLAKTQWFWEFYRNSESTSLDLKALVKELAKRIELNIRLQSCNFALKMI